LDVLTIANKLSNFTEWFNIWMFMSRENHTNGIGFQPDEPHMRSVFDSDDPVYGVDMRFFFEEVVFCDLDDLCKSEFRVESTAMVVDNQDFVTITLNPLPKVFYYGEFVQYTYLDSLSSVGGFWTIFLGLYLVLSALVVKFKSSSSGKDDFRNFGILPMLSKAYSNSEEIAYLRKIVMTLLNLQKEQVFRSIDEEESTDDLKGTAGEAGESSHKSSVVESVQGVISGLT